MLQYLINATAMWLISLIMYDVFLRRESYHGYNRFYLLFTFVLGALFPLVQWQGGGQTLPAGLEQPVARVAAMKENIVAAATPATFDWSQWLLIAYLAGAFVVLVSLVAEIIKLMSYYRSGKRSAQDGWTIIETEKEHAPFSLSNLLFVYSRQQYNCEEWRIILDHEKRHRTLLHFADLVVMQLGRVAFWFHPLAYIYNKRLLLVHEYQADKATEAQPQIYGRFLVEQALLQTAPTISHSFNRSPIKKRIVMLTRKSSLAARFKMLVFLPVALVCFFCFSKNVFSQKFEKNGNTVTYKGNIFELSEPQSDTSFVVDPVTGQEKMIVTETVPEPVKMNGGKVYNTDEVTSLPEFNSKTKSLLSYILTNAEKELSKLPDGSYYMNLSNVVIGIDGSILFYDYDGMKRADFSHNAQAPIPDAIQKEIKDKIIRLLTSARNIKPGVANGKKVPTLISPISFMDSIDIKDHKIN